jgi:hypothetical protein
MGGLGCGSEEPDHFGAVKIPAGAKPESDRRRDAEQGGLRLGKVLMVNLLWFV